MEDVLLPYLLAIISSEKQQRILKQKQLDMSEGGYCLDLHMNAKTLLMEQAMVELLLASE